ncbi:DHHC palmitoyltransferase-domain-containing protein [Paraphysoderma sedebokerense]|nr:DHHC palmitoyltransferase-domain-containing protein [Paraphysoderma sedebokerense]
MVCNIDPDSTHCQRGSACYPSSLLPLHSLPQPRNSNSLSYNPRKSAFAPPYSWEFRFLWLFVLYATLSSVFWLSTLVPDGFPSLKLATTILPVLASITCVALIIYIGTRDTEDSRVKPGRTKLKPGDLNVSISIAEILIDQFGKCKVCRVTVKDATYHCKRCNKCVQDLDHHCGFLNYCINSSNYNAFFTLITLAFVILLFLSYSSLFILNLYYQSPETKQLLIDHASKVMPNILPENIIILFTIYAVTLIVPVAFVLWLWLFHARLWWYNLTTNQWCQLDKNDWENPWTSRPRGRRVDFDRLRLWARGFKRVCRLSIHLGFKLKVSFTNIY